MRVLARAWQMLLKGITEVEESGRPLAAAEMVLVRLAYAADLPTPDEVIRSLDGKAARRRRRARPATAARRRDDCVSVLCRIAVRRRAAASAPRGAPRAALAAVQPVGDRHGRGAGGSDHAGAGGRQLRGVDGARGAEARPRRSRRRWSATCGWCVARTAGSTSRSSRARQDAGQRSVRQVLAMDRPALGRRRVARGGAADGEVAARRQAGRAQDRRAGRSAGAGGDGALPRCEDRRRARAPTRSPRCRRAIPKTTCRRNHRRPTKIPMVRIGCATSDFARINRGRAWPISWA